MRTEAPELETSIASATAPTSASRGWTNSGRVAFVLLTALYFLASLFASPDAYLSTDVGGKTGALAAMLERGDWSTDLGYWAESSDPSGRAHPFAHTKLTANGWWVNTTSLPMVLAARPLWALGGPQLALLLPMMAAAGAAVVAGRIQQRIDPLGRRTAVWVVGLATPVTVYALDFWEHSLGVLLMGLGSLGVLHVATEPRTQRFRTTAVPALGAGLAFGAAATMRQEALVYGFVAGLTLTVAMVRPLRSPLGVSFWSRILPSVAMACGALAMLVANAAAEIWFYGEPLRSSRSSGAVADAGSDLGDRADAMFTTLFSPINAIHPIATFFGSMLVVGLVWLMLVIQRGGDARPPVLLLIGLGSILGLRVVQSGPSFVPGMVPTAPLVVAGAWFGIVARSRAQSVLAAMALAPLPLVFFTQYAAGAVPQWGGRYLLTSGFLLVILACVELPKRHRQAFVVLAAVGLAVTGTGVWFTAERTNQLTADFQLIEDVAMGDVVVWYDPVKAREAGPEVVEHRWLSTVGDRERTVVVSILADESIDRFVYVDSIDADVVEFEGFAPVSALGEWELSPILNQRLTVFERT